MSAPAELLAWDTEFWGFRVGRARGSRLDPPGAEALDEWAKREALACLYLLADDESGTVAAAESAGFRLVEPRLTLTHEGEPQETTEVRRHQSEDLDWIRDLARRTRYVSRFAFDPGFPADRVVDYYETWAARSCEGWANAVLVAEGDGGPSGYITCHLPEKGLDAHFGIVAVEEGARGGDAAAALLMGGVRWLQAEGMRTVSVEVAGRNVRTQRYVQRYGFRTTDFRLYFHKWYR